MRAGRPGKKKKKRGGHFVCLHSARGLAHSKTFRVFEESSCRALRLGVRRPSAAFRLRTRLPERLPPERAQMAAAASHFANKNASFASAARPYPAPGTLDRCLDANLRKKVCQSSARRLTEKKFHLSSNAVVSKLSNLKLNSLNSLWTYIIPS